MNNITSQGIVREINKDKAKVFIKRGSMCGDSCGNCNMCGGRETIILADNTLNAKVGDNVTVSINQNAGFTASALIYGVPVAILIVGIFFLYALKLLTDLNLLFLLILDIIWYAVIFVLQKKDKLSFFEAEIISIDKE